MKVGDLSNVKLIKAKLGYIKDVLDPRDYTYAATNTTKPGVQSKFSLKNALPPVLNQGNLGSCVSNAVSNTLLYIDFKNKRPRTILYSRLFNYYNTRVLEGTVRIDSGCQIRDAIKVVNKVGSTDEQIWPYIIKKYVDRPVPLAYTDAIKKTVTKYRRVNQTRADIKSCISSGYPVIIGFLCFASMFTTACYKTGVIPMPKRGEQLYGGHCILLVGYDDATQTYEFQNSWGTMWGNKGFGTIPYAYIENPSYASDFWMIENFK